MQGFSKKAATGLGTAAFFALALAGLALVFAAAPAAQAATQQKGAAPSANVTAVPQQPSPAAAVPRQFREFDITRPFRAVDPQTLRAEGLYIHLWGVRPAQTSETPLQLKALDLMDSLIQEQQVTCHVVGGAMPELVARCATQNNQDLGLELLRAGYAVVDRRQTYDSVFASAYEKAQESARLSSKGVWTYVNQDSQDQNSLIPAWLKPHMNVLLPVALVLFPFGGLMIVALIMWYWLKRMADLQQMEAEQSSRKEEMLQTRERQVLISTLEGELLENKNKIEAFLVIYGDMLRSLQDTTEVPKYQQGGDIVQKHPGFGRTVFESNVNKLSLLDMKLAGLVSKLYSAMPKEQEYINLEPDVSLETAVKLVEKVLKEAEALLAPINTVLAHMQNGEKKGK
jgi:endonuclease YncB( thermonuclease family)